MRPRVVLRTTGKQKDNLRFWILGLIEVHGPKEFSVRTEINGLFALLNMTATRNMWLPGNRNVRSLCEDLIF